MTRLLVTGVGSNIGQGILKSLDAAGLGTSAGNEVLGTDVFRYAAGAPWCSKVYTVPLARDPEYVDALVKILKRHGTELVLIGSELETHVLARERVRIEAAAGCRIVTGDFELIDRCGDKWGVVQLLAEAGLDHADSTIDMAERAAFVSKHGFPVVLKPRRGWSARGVQVITDGESLDYFAKHLTDPILQEHLTGDEYTSAIVFDREGRYRDHIVMRRDLLSGTTFRAQVVSEPAIDRYIERFARSLPMRGPMNVQLRLTPRGPVAFEINPRFSGTTAIRMRAGFNDVAAIVRNFLNGTPIGLQEPRRVRILRYWEELVLEDGDERFNT